MVLASNEAQPLDGAVQPAIWNIAGPRRLHGKCGFCHISEHQISESLGATCEQQRDGKNAFNLHWVFHFYLNMFVNWQAKTKTSPDDISQNRFPETLPWQVKSQVTPFVDLPNESVKVSGTHWCAMDPAKYQKDSRGKQIFHVGGTLVQKKIYTSESFERGIRWNET